MRKPQTLVGEKEERLVLAIVNMWELDWPAKRHAEIVLALARVWQGEIVVEPVVGIEHGV